VIAKRWLPSGSEKPDLALKKSTVHYQAATRMMELWVGLMRKLPPARPVQMSVKLY
jgi:hypothetical protein